MLPSPKSMCLTQKWHCTHYRTFWCCMKCPIRLTPDVCAYLFSQSLLVGWGGAPLSPLPTFLDASRTVIFTTLSSKTLRRIYSELIRFSLMTVTVRFTRTLVVKAITIVMTWSVHLTLYCTRKTWRLGSTRDAEELTAPPIPLSWILERVGWRREEGKWTL